MHNIATLSLKQKALIVAGLLVLLAVAVTFALSIANRAEANQSVTGTAVLEASAMDIDMKVENGLMGTETVTNLDSTTPSTGNQQAEAAPKVDVEVNGTPIQVPENGTVKKEITTDEGSASINISSQSNTSSGHTRTRSSIKVDSDSSVKIRTETRE